jgi:PRC-barrel domain
VNRRVVLIGAVLALAACQSRPVAEQPQPATTNPEPAVETTPTSAPPEDANSEPAPTPVTQAANNVPPCLPETAKPKPAPKRHPRPPQGNDKATPVETLPPRIGSATPEVKSIDESVASILGKRVQGAEGEDLGRVVDVQADGTGRVRLVIIEFGGFLGVGNRRAAVDWSLLRFHPDDPERPITLAVGAKQVQATPEYRQASHPQALMAPQAPMPSAPLPTPTPAAAPAPAANPAAPPNAPPPQNK